MTGRSARRRYLFRTVGRSILEAPRDLAFRLASLGRPVGPIAPPYLRYRVIGDHRIDRFHESGLLALRDIERSLAALGVAWEGIGSVLDFGAGCGKLTRWMLHRSPHLRLSACDVDPWAVRWLRRAFPAVDVRRNDELPPLAFRESSFDLIVAISVFTHLDEWHQDVWLQELHRLCRPGGLIVATVEGVSKWKRFFETAPDHPGMKEYQRRYESEGFLYVRDDGWTGIFPDFYHSAFHSPAYVLQRWGETFDVGLQVADGLRGNWGCQDLVVLRNRVGADGGDASQLAASRP